MVELHNSAVAASLHIEKHANLVKAFGFLKVIKEYKVIFYAMNFTINNEELVSYYYSKKLTVVSLFEISCR